MATLTTGIVQSQDGSTDRRPGQDARWYRVFVWSPDPWVAGETVEIQRAPYISDEGGGIAESEWNTALTFDLNSDQALEGIDETIIRVRPGGKSNVRVTLHLAAPK